MLQTPVRNRKDSKLRHHIETLIKELPPFAGPNFIDELAELNESCIAALDSEPEALQCSLFVKAIKDHYRPHDVATEHIYLRRYEIPQIQLFDILISKFPFVVSAHAISNRLISKWVGDHSSAVILDIGIGRGIQMASLIRELAANTDLKELTIIGIEPFTDAISHAMYSIDEAAASARFKVNVSIVEGFAENTRATELKKLLPVSYDRLIVNGSLAIHHIPSIAMRRQFFDKIRMLAPDAMVMTEPHVDHMTDDWRERTGNAWMHYSAVFDTIDQLEISETEKNGLKMFFSREITDVVATPDTTRFERHEPAHRWIAYGKQSGLSPEPRLQAPATATLGAVTISADDGCIMMKRNKVDVLAIIPLINTAKNN